ncbi:MAG: hypothetical protein ACUVQP_07095 [Bacteroidales bacterium]
MINIGIRYFDKDTKCEGIIMAGDKGVQSPVRSGDIVLECEPFRRMGAFPVIIAPTGGSRDSAVVSNYIEAIFDFLSKRYKPNKFLVSQFTSDLPEFHRLISEIYQSYYTERELKGMIPREVKYDFDFILAGSDFTCAAFLYYGRIGRFVEIADAKFVPGYVTSFLGGSEGLAFLKEILQSREIPRRVALETAVSILEMLKKVKQAMSPNYQLLVLERGKVMGLEEEILEKVCGIMDYRWNALWVVLKNALQKPKYLDYVLNKLGGLR